MRAGDEKMRDRVLGALQAAAGDLDTHRSGGDLDTHPSAERSPSPGGVGPPDPHVLLTHDLARQVVRRDRARGWSIAAQPARLRILTVDALCHWLARRLPLSSGLPVDAATVEDPEPRLLTRSSAEERSTDNGEVAGSNPAGSIGWGKRRRDGETEGLRDLET